MCYYMTAISAHIYLHVIHMPLQHGDTNNGIPFYAICYAMLCYAMLCYGTLCYVMLCYAMQKSNHHSFKECGVYSITCF